MRRREDLYLQDIVAAARRIGARVDGRTRQDFLDDVDLQESLLYRMIIIGEAAAHVSPAIKSRYSTIQWPEIVGFRNFAVHAYFAFDYDIAWDAATLNVPRLLNVVEDILSREYPTSTAQSAPPSTES